MLRVVRLFTKPGRARAMVAVDEVRGIAGLGLEGDASADAASPRQVLVASLADVAALGVEPSDLRANVVVDGDLGGLASGDVLALGDVRLRITLACEPCSKLDRIRPRLARAARGRRGLLARVLTSGRITPGTVATLDRAATPPLDPSWRTRALRIVTEIPPGQVLTHAALVRIAGVHPSYCRALPSLLRSRAAAGLPVERVVTSAARDVWDGASHYAAEEGR